jgi:hypothetical protein
VALQRYLDLIENRLELEFNRVIPKLRRPFKAADEDRTLTDIAGTFAAMPTESRTIAYID